MIHEFLRMGNVVADALQARAEIGQALASAFRIAANERRDVEMLRE
jgi:acetyl esterase